MKHYSRLASIIEGGRTRYILEHGVLGWGLLTDFLVAAWTCYSQDGLTKREFFTTFTIYPFGGIFWGAFMWSSWKRQFQKQREEKANKDAEQDAPSDGDKHPV
jgi:hypothetical protein